MNNKQKIIQYGYENAIIYQNPDFDKAIIGVDANSGSVIYDYQLMISCLMQQDKISYEQAVDFIDFNTIRATPYMPQPRPIILQRFE